MSEYNTLFEFDASWKVTQLVVTRALDEVQSGLLVTFAQEEQSITLAFEHIDDPQNIMELMDFQQVTVSEECNVERDFSTIKVELFCDSYAEFWCDAVTTKQIDS